MAINFCNEKLVKISTDQVSSDHHDVQNLISSNENDRQKGFLVEYYIRPPVIIKIEFTKHNLDLMYIELGLQVRQHRSRGIEVYAITSTSQGSQLIAKCFNPTQEKLTIVNSCYRPNRTLPQINSTFPDSFTIAGRNVKHCSNINCILIKILSTVNSTVPCLSHLDIYGKPNGVFNDELRTFCDTISDKATNNSRTSTSDHMPRERSEQSWDLSHQIEHLAPVEFFDSITNELMKTPFLLPSGKNIDKITLNKYLATTNDYTPPSDPFTRIPFTDQSKPVLNAVLKARIDLFFCSNGQSEIDRRNELRRRLLNLP